MLEPFRRPPDPDNSKKRLRCLDVGAPLAIEP